ncbi:MAG TPA: helix-turn-helix transcriptional regulator [Verrucomicrobiota bacterium]|nr:helix-turn-helix transcriptional regulator [Verrucomicrobiota bacterium]
MLPSQRHSLPPDIHCRIQRAREWLGLTREGVEDEYGISVNTLSKLEQHGIGSTHLIRRIIEALDGHLKAVGEPTISLEPDTPPVEREDWLFIPKRDWGWRMVGPGAMLDPLYRFVRFHGRGETVELPRLKMWCDSKQAYAVRAYSAHGGAGKTRLALELCELMTQNGWEAGFLHATAFPNRARGAAIFGHATNPLLIVVDYAADPANMAVLQRLIPSLPASRRPKVRLLMMERDSLWLGRLRDGKEVNDILDDAAVEDGDLNLALRSVGSLPKERESSFEIAATAFQRTLPGINRKTAPPRGPPNPGSKIYNEVFYLHALAHEIVTGNRDGSPTKLAIVRRMLARERTYWANILAARKLPDYLIHAFESAVEAVGRMGGVSTIPDAIKLVGELPEFADQPKAVVKQIAMVLREIYPDDGVGIAPLQPDLLKQCLADEWLAIRPRN